MGEELQGAKDAMAQAPQAQAPQQGGGGQSDEIMKLLQQSGQPKKQLIQPKVNTKAGNMGTNIALGTLGMIVPSVAGAIQGAIKANKEKQINAAMNDWATLDGALEDAQARSGGDPSKVNQLFTSDPRVQAILSDPKKQKNFAKVFSMDWMNPDKGKDHAYHQGLQRFMRLKPASQMMKKMQEMVMGHRDQMQQKQQDPQQQQQQVQKLAQMLPTQTQTATPEQAHNIAISKAELEKAEAALRDKYQIGPDAQGNIVAINKADPTDVIRVTDKDGNIVTGASRGKNGPLSVNNVPVGVFFNGRPYTPDTPGWTAQMAKDLEQYKAAWATGEAAKDHRIKLAADSRVMSFMNTREYAAVNANGELVFATPAEIKAGKANGVALAPATQGVQAMNRQAIFNEIGFTQQEMNKAIEGLPETDTLDTSTRAQLAAVLRDEDPRSAWSKFLGSTAADTLSEPLQNYVTALVAMDESALSLRSLAGMGGGSDMLRGAIMKMLPGAGTPSKSYARRQMYLFGGEVANLQKSVPKVGGKSGGSAGDGPEREVRDKSGKLLGYTRDGKTFSRMAK